MCVNAYVYVHILMSIELTHTPIQTCPFLIHFPDVAETENLLAQFYYEHKKFSKLEAFYLESIKAKQTMYGLDDPCVAHTLKSLGDMYLDQLMFKKV